MLIKQYKTYQTIQKLPGGTIYRLANGTTGEMFFTYTDYPSADGQVLGSITHITDSAGNLLHEQSFDAWGRARDPDTYEYPAVQTGHALSLTNDRGYTGHEMLPQFGIINMNGRLYDPIVGRMLSPDPYVQMPDYSQNFNRYSYAFNNPLIYSDPSGEIVWFAPVIIGAAIGGFSGYMIGDAAGAKGWDMAGYIAGGALIGGLSGGAAAGISAAGGGTMLAGAGTGAIGGAGFSGMATGWDGNAMLTGAVNGAIAGFVGGGVGSAIGGGWGAFAGGASGNLTSQLLYNDGDFSQVNWGAVGVSGAVSLGMYHGMQYMQYKAMGGRLGQMDVTYRQYAKINTAYQRSSFWKKEHGVILNRDGSARFAPQADRNKFDVTLRINHRNGDYATAHTHWAKDGVDWVDVGGTGTRYQRYNAATAYPIGSTRFTSVGGYHSPQDLTIPGYSLVVGRTSGTYSIGGAGYHYINPDPYLRFFLFPWNW